MIVFFLLIFIFYFIDSNIKIIGFHKDYLDRKNTLVVNGAFVLIIFLSHFTSYFHGTNTLDQMLVILLEKIGQLMVTTFLFYSGYGIYENIKRDKDKYIKEFPKKRFLVTWGNFAFAVILFLIVGILQKEQYSIQTIILAFLGYESIGNSTWFMFDTFLLYLAVLFSFSLFKTKDKYHLIIITILSIGFIFLLNQYKADWWCNTILCFVSGMWYSYGKEKIDSFIMKNNKNYGLLLLFLLSCFVFLYINAHNVYIYNILAVTFVWIINLLSMKITSKNKILIYFGKNVFWIYILQRIPMRLLKPSTLNIYLIYFICFFSTLFLMILMKKITTKFWKKCNQ